MAGTTIADQSMQMRLKEYIVTGRAKPTEKKPEPTVYRMSVFARDDVIAESRFWYFMSRLNKVLKSKGEVLDCHVKEEENTDTVKNYGIWLRYDSRTETINMYKEFRDISKVGAVSQLYQDMSGRHRAQHDTIQIMKIKALEDEDVRRPHILQLMPEDLKFPQLRIPSMADRKRRVRFVRKTPVLFAG